MKHFKIFKIDKFNRLYFLQKFLMIGISLKHFKILNLTFTLWQKILHHISLISAFCLDFKKTYSFTLGLPQAKNPLYFRMTIFCILLDFLLEDLKPSVRKHTGLPLSLVRKALPFHKTENSMFQSISLHCIKDKKKLHHK